MKVLRKLGFETWQEVLMGEKHFINTPYCDIIGLYSNNYYAFELKTSLSDKVIYQAKKLSSLVNYTYIIVPISKKGTISEVKRFYLAENGLGLIFLDINKAYKFLEDIPSNTWSNNDILMDFYTIGSKLYKKASFNEYNQKIDSFLFDKQKETVAGSTSGVVKTTPFKRSCVLIYDYLQENPKATKKEVWEKLKDRLHWVNYGSMTSSFRNFSHLDIIKRIKWFS